METEDPRRPSRPPAPGIYPSSVTGATSLFEEVLRPLLAGRGSLRFDQFMELALYHETHGYYSDPARRRIGRGGDFATNVSVGAAFGRLLALRLHHLWLAHGAPPDFAVLELGPEDGSLALDILSSAPALAPEFRAALRYTACEPSARKRTALARRFEAAGETEVSIIADPVGHRAPFGAVLANEVLDALPVRALRFTHGRWLERHVTVDEHALVWTDRPIEDAELSEVVASLGTAFPDDYQTEVCLELAPFFRAVAPMISRGLFLFVDYGFPRADYYHPHRSRGTLRTYAGHRSGHDPLDSPGQRDITCHVDFTRAAECARAAGLVPIGLARQESYLVHLARPLLDGLDRTADAREFLSQFRTLTHPALFGSRFNALEFAKGPLSAAFAFPCVEDGLRCLA